MYSFQFLIQNKVKAVFVALVLLKDANLEQNAWQANKANSLQKQAVICFQKQNPFCLFFPLCWFFALVWLRLS